MANPWEQYQNAPEAPAAKPWEQYRQPNQAVADTFKQLPTGTKVVEGASAPAKPAVGFFDKLLGLNGTERVQTWPERMARSAATLPGDVYSGREPITDATGHTTEPVIERAQDMAGVIGLSGPPRTGPRGVAQAPEVAAARTEPAPVITLERGKGNTYNIHDAQGGILASADIHIVNIGGRKLAQIEDINTPALENVKTQTESDAAVQAARNTLGTATMRTAMRKFLEMNPDVEGFTGNRVSGARNAGNMNADNIQNVTVPVKTPKPASAAGPWKQYAPAATSEPTKPPGALRSVAQTAEKIFSPETVDRNADQAVSLIRSATGRAARDTAVTDAALEPFHARVNALEPQDRLAFIDHVENKSKGAEIPDRLHNYGLNEIADTLRDAFQSRREKIEKMPEFEHVNFVEDYFPHFWKDPNKASDFLNTYRSAGSPSKQGSGASLKTRTMPTIADGIKAGLEPVTTNPIEAALRYVHSMDQFLASNEVRSVAKDQGMIKYVRPKVMGASGHPDSFKVPEGWAPLKGRGATDAMGAQAYAPEGFARVYNNYLSRGFAEIGPEFGSAMNGARRVSNGVTALELGLSGYHALTMAQEAMVNQLAKAIGNLRTGHPVEAGKDVLKTPIAPVTRAMQGKKLADVYLGRSPGTSEARQIADLLAEGGGRGAGARHAPDYDFSKQGSYVTAIKRGALKSQLVGDMKDIFGKPVTGPLAVGARHIGRIMDTVAQPLFEKYIPALKNGAFYENMSAWLKQNPAATREQQVRASRQILDSTDNRFGEMVSDNVFWNKALKEVAMLALRSWSWTVGGSMREIGGGIRDFARGSFKKIDPNNIGPNDKRWTQKMDYVLALPIVYGGLSAIYQGLKTGEPPRDIRDLLAPRTGGTDANSGEPERLLMPGYMKDVFGFAEHPWQEMKYKLATAPVKAVELMDNKNWRGDPIRSPRDKDLSWLEQTPVWLRDYWKYATESFGPITARNLAKGQKTGSNISAPEAALGVRTAPRQFIDPEGYEKMMEGINRRDWQKKLRHDKTEQQRYGGTE